MIGPPVPDLMSAARSAQAAVAGLVASKAWPSAPRPVLASDLLPERAIDGDPAARRQLIDAVYLPLVAAGGGLLETVTAYLATQARWRPPPGRCTFTRTPCGTDCGGPPTSPGSPRPNHDEGFALQIAIVARAPRPDRCSWYARP